MNILFLLLPKNQVDFLYSDFTVRQALEKMKGKNYTMVPVIDRSTGKYARSLMSGDFLDYLALNKLSFEEMADHPLSDIVASRHIASVGVNCQIQELYRVIVDQNFVPVVDDNGVFIGIVTRRAVLSDLIPGGK
jgi:CBS domain-containing protein